MKNILVIILIVFAFFHINRTNNYTHGHTGEMADPSFISAYYDAKRTTEQRKPAGAYDCIVLLVIDGLRYDHAFIPGITPRLSGFARANGIMYTEASAMQPTVSAPNYMSIVTGAPAYIHGVVSNNSRDRSGRMPATIFDSLNTCGLQSVIIGFEWYKEMFGKTGAVYLPAECCEKDDPQELAAVISMLFRSGARPALTLVHFLAPDNASHKNATGPEYEEAIRGVDAAVGSIIDTIQPLAPRTLFIITADHGVEKDGTHGGYNRSSRHVPLYFYSASLPPSSVSRPVSSLSIAPTMAALLGVCIPPLSSGTILYEAMDDIRAGIYLTESIYVKERFLENRGIKSTGVMNVTMNARDTLIRRDDELTMSILGLYDTLLRSVPAIQRIACSILLICLAAFVIFRSPAGTPIIISANGIIICASGLVMPLIDSNARLTTAMPLLTMTTLAFALLHYYYHTGDTASRTTCASGSATGLLALLLAEALFLAGLFIPFNPSVPDLGVYPFRFFYGACMNTFFIFLLTMASFALTSRARHLSSPEKND